MAPARKTCSRESLCRAVRPSTGLCSSSHFWTDTDTRAVTAEELVQTAVRTTDGLWRTRGPLSPG